MKNFKAISMDCNQEQFESMREELIDLGCVIDDVTDFDDGYTFLCTNYAGNLNHIINFEASSKSGCSRTYIGAFDKEAFLQACGKVEVIKKSGWYISTNGSKWMMYVDFEKGIKFGFGLNGDWMKCNDYGFCDATKANNEEILQRLTEEAEKRGYKGLFELSETMLLCDGVCVMTNGIWADIVADEIEVVDPVDVSELAELKKEKTTLLKSRNRYKQLYQQEKDRANGLAIENSELHKGEVFLIQEVKSFEHELADKKESNDELYRIGCQFGSENDKLKKQLKTLKICYYTLVAITIISSIYLLLC